MRDAVKEAAPNHRTLPYPDVQRQSVDWNEIMRRVAPLVARLREEIESASVLANQ